MADVTNIKKDSIRNLNASDLMAVVTIFGKVGSNLNMQEGMTNAAMGIQFVSTACQYAEQDMTELLASISQMTVEEFKKMPIDFPLEIIEQLAEKEDLKAFFTRVKALTEKLFKK